MTYRAHSAGWFKATASVVALTIILSQSPISPATAVGEVVMGQVTYPNGTGAPNVEVELHLADGTQRFTTLTDVNGNYAFSQNLTPGLSWYVGIRAPEGYNRPTDVQSGFIYQTGDPARTINFRLISAPKIISGRVTDTDGNPVNNADIEFVPATNQAGSEGVRTQNDGTYSKALRPGTWFVNAIANLSEQNVRWITESVPVEVAFSNTDEAQSAAVNFTVTPANGNLKVRLLNSDGGNLTTSNFVADITVFRADGIGTIRKVNQADSTLNIWLTPGIYTIAAFHQDLTGKSFDPQKTTFVMTENGTVDLGTVQAEANSAHLKGKVTNASGQGMSNVSVQAIREGGHERPWANTDQNGNFDLVVGAGTWVVGLNVPTGDPVYSQTAPATATVENGETVTGLNIQFKAIDKSVTGKVVTAAGATATDFLGSAYVRTANNKARATGPVINGEFTVKYASSDVPGNSVIVGAEADPGSPYAGKNEAKVTISGSSATQNVTVQAYDATLSGFLKKAAGPVTNAGSDIEVIAMDTNSNFASTVVNADGSYSLSLAAGTWMYEYTIEDETATPGLLNRPAGSNSVAIKAGETLTRDLTVLEGANTITGTLTDAFGNPVKRSQVILDNRPSLENNSNANPQQIVTLTVETDENGTYTAKVPDGTFLVTAGDTPAVNQVGATTEQLPPDGKTVKVSGAGSATANLVYERTNATIAGTVSLKNKADGGGTVKAWTDDGAQAEAAVDANGKYALNVTSGEVWHVAATDLTSGNLAASETVNVTPKAGSNTANLKMADTKIDVPGPVSKSFSADQPASVSLPDGTAVSVPARALGLTGSVSLTVTPVVDLDQTGGDVSASLAYEVKAIDPDGRELKKLNRPATITLPYEQRALESGGLSEKTLAPKFFSPQTEQWETTMGVVDKKDNTATLLTNHLTKFSVTGLSKPQPKIAKAVVMLSSPSALVLTVTGKNFSGKLSATLGGVKATKVIRQGSSRAIVTFPAAKLKPGKGQLILTNGNGRQITKDKAMTIVKRGGTVTATSRIL